MDNKININFKTDRQTKALLDNLVVLKIARTMKMTTQHEIFVDALFALLEKYKQDTNENNETE